MISRIRNIFIHSILITLVSLEVNTLYGQCNFSNGPAGELCTSASYVCGNQLNGFTGRLPKKLSASQLWTGLCNGDGTADNIVWFSFTPCSNKVTLEITPSNCSIENVIYTGIQAGFFSDCNKNASLACTDHTSNNGITTVFTLSSSGFTPGITAYLFIDGYAGSVCDFSIKVIEGFDLTPVSAPDPKTLGEGFITGQNVISCTEIDKPISYNLTPPQCQINTNPGCSAPLVDVNPSDSICYVWQVSPNVGRYFVNQDSVGRFTDIIFTQPGTYTISSQAFFHPFYGGSCANSACGKINTWTVTVNGPDTITNAPIFICPGANYSFCGSTITSDSLIVCSSDPCNIVRQPFKVGTSQVNFLGTQYICAGGSFDFQGQKYTTPGSYQQVDANDCTLLHRFTIQEINISVTIDNAPLVLDCNNTKIKLQSTATSNGVLPIKYTWTNSSGVILSTQSTLDVTAPGVYIVDATYDVNSTVCKATDNVTISQDIKKPNVAAIIPTVKCKKVGTTDPVLTLLTSDNLSFAQWTNPLGTKSTGLNISVDYDNVVLNKPYLFSAIGTNGCALDTSFMVPYNFTKAKVNLTGDDISCYEPEPTLFATVDIKIDSIRWSRLPPNDAFYISSTDQFTLVNSYGPGKYFCEVMASVSNCWSSVSLDIYDIRSYPNVDVGQDKKWYCNTSTLNIIALTNTGPEFEYDWSTNNGQISSPTNGSDILVKSPGTYNLIVSNKTNGCTSEDKVTIVQETNVPTSINYKAHDLFCKGANDGTLDLEGVVGGFGPYTFYLDGKKLDTQTLNDLSAGDYSVEVRDKYECSYVINVTIGEPSAVEVTTEPEYTIAFNEALNLDFTSNYPINEIADVKWVNSKGEILSTDFDFTFTSAFSEEVEVIVTTVNGCEARAKIKINVDNTLELYFPNIFSPNGDNINDKFVIWKNTIPANIDKLVIFDRFGNKVYEQLNFAFEDNPLGWDGTFNGQQVEAGVYVYVVQYTDFTGTKQIIKKDLTLVR